MELPHPDRVTLADDSGGSWRFPPVLSYLPRSRRSDRFRRTSPEKGHNGKTVFNKLVVLSQMFKQHAKPLCTDSVLCVFS
jgi:hypothetical protein